MKDDDIFKQIYLDKIDFITKENENSKETITCDLNLNVLKENVN